MSKDSLQLRFIESNFLCARAARPARLLTEEGGSRPPPMVRVPSRVPAIHASLALRGPALHATWVTQLADRYLQPHTIMVHVSDGRSANATMVTLSVRAHLLLNPESRRVAKNGPGILGVHLSNLELLLHSEIHPDDDDKFVLVASNQQFFRPCREHVLQHSLSFSLGQTVDVWKSKKDTHEGLPFPSPKWRALMARLPRQDDAFIQNNLWFKNWVAWMHSDARPAGWDRSPLTYMPHEGTFYPLHVVRAFSALLAGSALDVHRPCPFSGACFYEETLLPTFVWQRYPQLLNGSNGPPIVLRVWSKYNVSITLTKFNLHSPHLRYICAVKAPGQTRPPGLDEWVHSQHLEGTSAL